MPEGIDFIDFPYFSVTYVHPNASALNSLLYPSLIQRYISNLVFVTTDCPLPPRFGQCRHWLPDQEPVLKTPWTLAHKYRGSISPRLISLALARPGQVEQMLLRRRLPRATWKTQCGDPGCLHPLHLYIDQDPVAPSQAKKPRIRHHGKRTVDWLTMPEMHYLESRMRFSFAKDPADILTAISEDIDIHFTTLFDVWNQIVDYNRKRFYETFIVLQGEHHL
jgi:hypothetical protein